MAAKTTRKKPPSRPTRTVRPRSRTAPRPARPSAPEPCDSDDARVGMNPGALRRDILDNLRYEQARFPEVATSNDWYLSLAHAIRDRVLQRWTSTAHTYKEQASRTVCYLSAEFMLGPHLLNNIINLGLESEVREAIEGIEGCPPLDQLIEQEEEPGLGNGGLGRLAACFLDSLATLNIPAIGYSIRYEYGIFDQAIRDGWQVERSDTWLRLGNPWEIARPEICYDLSLGGSTRNVAGPDGALRVEWTPERRIRAMAYDTPILGYRTNTACLLRLWKAEGYQAFDLAKFNHGDFWGAVVGQMASETITKVLYPNDKQATGKQLRLEQQYLFVSCALQDMVRIHKQGANTLDNFHEKYAIQLNDTHPSIAIAELMRLLLDEHGYAWDAAWSITRQTFAYTNHTLLPEALEKWPLGLFAWLLPRHMEIIYEINRRFIDELRAQGADDDRVRRMSIIDESGERYVRMAHLACIGSHTINGVARLHSRLLASDVLPDFAASRPREFTNVTNGVSPRRFIRLANPGLSELITSRIGDGWVRDLDKLRQLERFADDRAFVREVQAVKLANKTTLAGRLSDIMQCDIDPRSMFDIQVKRIHEYKRQHLNILHAITLYRKITCNPKAKVTPRTIIFGGKAAPGYAQARLIIKLIHAVARIVNNDPVTHGKLRIAFYPDFNVKNAQRIYPAADLSEQISTAGKEASGTGNMKFTMNGALTIGTLDGANVEIHEAVGDENFFLFGRTVEQVRELRIAGYRPWEMAAADPELDSVLWMIRDGAFSPEDPGLFRPLVDSLLAYDEYMLIADYRSYIDCQERVAKAYQDQPEWGRMATLNIARSGMFSSDRSIRDYATKIWHVKPVRITLGCDM